MSIKGYCDPKFSRVEEYFADSINSKFELGASISIEIEGERVINLWGGFKDAKNQCFGKKIPCVIHFLFLKQ